jgi:adenosine deaminase
VSEAKPREMDAAAIQALPKVLLHEHLDCSLRTGSMLEFWSEDKWPIPDNFPRKVRDLFQCGRTTEASIIYQSFLAQEASLSLAKYVMAIVHHVLPLMQTAARLTRITKERLGDAAADGVAALELRFAPQLHTQGGLGLEAVMEAVLSGIASAPFPVRLIVCTLRHEDESMARQLADLSIAYKEHVGAFDLAGDEKANPGVLPWWARQALRVREHGIDTTVHLWETDEPTDDDLLKLAEYGIKRLGHGFRGSRQEDRILEVCPSSNVVTGQLRSLAEHPVDKLLRQGSKVTINTDGTLFTRSDLSHEYQLLNRFFGWSVREFLTVNKTAAEASSFSRSVKDSLIAKLSAAYQEKSVS